MASVPRKGNALPIKPSMFSRHIVRALCTSLLIATVLIGAERNVWPLVVQQVDSDGKITAAEYLGPLFFHKLGPDGEKISGFRPFFLKRVKGSLESNFLLYPFFTWKNDDDFHYFTFLNLINFREQKEYDRQISHSAEFWPFYLSRQTGDPSTSYRALFPVVGTTYQRLGYDKIHFVLFPLYADAVKNGGHTTHVPWPFLRFIHGAGEHGFEFWPLFGHRGRANDYDSKFFVWPLIYQSKKDLSEPQPSIKRGVLPFYSSDTRTGLMSETYVWPFFGYTHQTTPAKYDEIRYFWPLLVQGRGENSSVNRWAPLYTYSVRKGQEKTWVLWPIFRESRWVEGRVAQKKTQILYRLYWSLTQRSLTNPAAAPAFKTHLWPLASVWNNGAGRRQVQLLSPFEVFFPTNETVRQVYSPLVAIYRFDQRSPGDTSHSVLFSLLSWKKSPVENEFHFGPLLSRRSAKDATRITVGLGLLSWQRQADARRWNFSVFDFHSPSSSPTTPALSP